MHFSQPRLWLSCPSDYTPTPMDWSPPPGTHALIFDCDGTLADTMPIHFRAWTALLGPRGIPFPEVRFYALGGMPTARIIRLLAAECGVPVDDVDTLVWEKERAFLAGLHDVTAIEPVLKVAATHRNRLPMAVASGGYREVIHQTLDYIKVRDWFAAVVCAEDTPLHKPEPDVFLEAARQLRVPAIGCVVFEDTEIGLEAARRAGMHAVDVREWRTAESVR
jgi:beta-phosphoglucomutase-like phosphatase (HAD superfamily)